MTVAPNYVLSEVDTGKYLAWTPNAGPQASAITCPIPEILYGGARGGGKTDCLLGKWLVHAARYRNAARGIILRRSTDELDEIKGRAEEIFPKLGARYSAMRRAWYFPGGAILKFRHLARDADASKYQGHSYTFVGIDEAGNFPSPDPIDKLKATLRTKYAGVRCEMFLTANPGGPGHGWLKKRYIDPAKPMTPIVDPTTGEVRIFIPSLITDNPYLSKDKGYLNRIRGSGPAWLVAAWEHGDWNATPEGGIYKSRWWKDRYALIPANAVFCVQSWDTAYKPKETNDYSVCTTWLCTPRDAFLLHVYRARADYPTVKRMAKSLGQLFKPDAILIEDKGSGQSLIQELREETPYSVIDIMPDMDKVLRALASTAMMQAGRIHLPELAPWLVDLEIELTTFPLAAHDDQVDSVSQFINWFREHGVGDAVPMSSGARDSAAAAHQYAQDHAMATASGRSSEPDNGFGTIPGASRGYAGFTT